MKITCSRQNLIKGVSTVNKAVPSRTTMPILYCVLINAEADQIKLTANDMELGIETVIEGAILERGKIALDAKLFFDIVRKLPDNEVTIETGESFQTKITCENAEFKLIGQDADEFSPLPFVAMSDAVTLSQFTLKEMIRQTIFSIADNDSNKIMTGELFEIKGDKFEVASLDGHRISIRKEVLNNQYEDRRLIVPGKSLQEISKILPGDADKNVNIYYTDNHILFAFDETLVVSRLIEGNYFQIEQMLSSDYETKLVINRRMLLDCIERGSLLTSESEKKPVIFDIKDNQMELKIRSFVGSMNEIIPIQKEGADLMIGFNPKFFIDALRVLDEEEITLYLINPKAPCFIRDEEEMYTYLILPVNFNEGDY